MFSTTDTTQPPQATSFPMQFKACEELSVSRKFRLLFLTVAHRNELTVWLAERTACFNGPGATLQENQ